MIRTVSIRAHTGQQRSCSVLGALRAFKKFPGSVIDGRYAVGIRLYSGCQLSRSALGAARAVTQLLSPIVHLRDSVCIFADTVEQLLSTARQSRHIFICRPDAVRKFRCPVRDLVAGLCDIADSLVHVGEQSCVIFFQLSVILAAREIRKDHGHAHTDFEAARVHVDFDCRRDLDVIDPVFNLIRLIVVFAAIVSELAL